MAVKISRIHNKLDVKWFQKELAAQNEPEEDIDPDVAAMMGFGGFRSSKK